MCGIAGFLNFHPETKFDSALLERMGEAVVHRGPDAKGIFSDPAEGVGLAHRRLSIIDLAGGVQPMANQDQTLWIVFNGEIYNFLELRAELSGRGSVFRTRSDTEVILKGYEASGIDFFKKLNGIFAFAIYDRPKRKLVLARDPFGVKPLYYHLNAARLAFGSEIKSILSDPSVSRKVSAEALDEFLLYRYNPSPNTLFEGIRKLAPGHTLEISRSGGAGRPQAYLCERPAVRKITEIDAIREYRRLLRAAVKRQLISDVPLGLFLSGGVDSAVLAKLMSEESGHTVSTFTVGFAGQGDFNELHDARQTADLIGTRHQDLLLEAEDYLDFFCRSFESVEEPIAETTISALHHVSRLAAQQFKVVLAGQGADEPMGGYARYLGVSYIEKYEPFLSFFAPLVNRLPRNNRLKHAAFVLGQGSEAERLKAIYTIFGSDERQWMYHKEYARVLVSGLPPRLRELAYQARDLRELVSKIMFIDTRMSLADDLLLFNDKITMANSLEMRVPFLDLELIAFLDSLPANMKIRGTRRKYIHKCAAAEWLPASIIDRKKRGFQTPMDEWLQKDLAGSIQLLFSEKNSACRRFFRIEYIEELIRDHRLRRQNHQKKLYSLLSFELWHRTWIDRDPVEPSRLFGEKSRA